MAPRRTLPDVIQRVVDLAGRIRRNSKAHAIVDASPVISGDRRIDSNDLPPQIDQWATAIARIYRRVSLDEALKLPRSSFDVAPLGAHNARSHRRLQAERASDGQNPIADSHGVRIAELRDGERLVRVNLDNGNVRPFVDANNPGFIRRAVLSVQGDLDLINRFLLAALRNHVIVRQDVAVLVQNDAGTQALLTEVPLWAYRE